MERYRVLEVIGEGSFGRVYKGRRRYSAQVVALKFIPKVGRSEKELKNLQREIEIMRGLHHPNIIQMLDSFETDKEVVVVTDYAEGELFQILEDDGSLPEEQVQAIAAQLVSALYYLHSHRILHRDMKPQNILLGKGGIIKLCDFGFARAMSIHTMVLTSIKGTPLYMSPELVEERPYDHTADLWSVGCILYELFVGTPPFYTSSIFQLVNLIVKDPVKWPEDISPVFKSFLQGLLMKDPRQRLSWPELLSHPFIAGRVTVIDDTEEHGISNPFTTKLTPELQALKEQQAHSLAPRSGQSKILRKARQKMAEDTRKKGQLKMDTASVKEPDKGHQGRKCKAAPGKAAFGQEEPAAAAKEKTTGILQGGSSTAEWELEEAPPSAREHSITRDYEQEFPETETLGEPGPVRAEPGGRRSIETVDLESEELESDEEWQHLMEATEPSALQPSRPQSLLRDPTFRQRVRLRLADAGRQVLEGMLEGASHLRPALQVVGNLLATQCDLELLHHFCQELDVPLFLLCLAKKILENSITKQQPWCVVVLTDLIMVTTVYFSSECSLEGSQQKDSPQAFQECTGHLLALLPELLAQAADSEMRLCQQSLLCFTLLCENLDTKCPSISAPFYASLREEHQPLLNRLLQGSASEQPALQGSATMEPRSALDQRQHVVDLFTAALAAACSIPLERNGLREAKQQVSQEVAEKLMEGERQQLGRLLGRLEHPNCSLNVLKILYAGCHASPSLCQHLGRSQQVCDSLMHLSKGKVPMADVARGAACEASLHLLALLTLQLQGSLPRLEEVVTMAVDIVTQSPVVSFVGAAAFLLAQLSQQGASVALRGEEILPAVRNALTATAELQLPPPLGAGIYDGLFFLLLKLLAQEDVAAERSLAASELWRVVWHRVAAVLRVASANVTLEGGSLGTGHPTSEPDWNLLSPQGVLLFLSLALSVFICEQQQCLPQLARPRGVLLETLRTLLSPGFLACLAQTQEREDGDPELVPAVVLQACQLLCFPFALDVDEDTLASLMEGVRDSQIPAHLLQACCHHLPFSDTELPMRLLCHFVVSDEQLIDQTVREAAASEHIVAFLTSALFSDNSTITGDLLSLLTHVARVCPEHLPFLQKILGASDVAEQPLTRLLGHWEHPIRAKTCNLVGNLLRHSPGFLQSQLGMLERLLERLADQDERVRKAAAFAVGNAAYHECSPAGTLGRAVPGLTRLLSDVQAATRRNAASALGNVGRRSAALGDLLIQSKAPNALLEVACWDPQARVREGALAALRAISQHPAVQQVLLSLRASEKLAALASRDSQSSAGSSSRPSSTRHCRKLIHLLAPVQGT
ncbi:STK36 kinase, partial [Nothoprocta ornata]|nr:STK36 kinase [Nothoprocta ornata]